MEVELLKFISALCKSYRTKAFDVFGLALKVVFSDIFVVQLRWFLRFQFGDVHGLSLNGMKRVSVEVKTPFLLRCFWCSNERRTAVKRVSAAAQFPNLIKVLMTFCSIISCERQQETREDFERLRDQCG